MMKKRTEFACVFILLVSPTVLAKGAKDYPIKPVPFNKVQVNDRFWSPRLETNRKVTLWHIFEQCAKTGRVDNFAIAAGLKKGKYTGYQFNDSDVYKAIEGAAYILQTQYDANLDHYLDSLIAIIAAAQEPDGYLYTPRRLMSAEYQPPGGKVRWVGEKDGSHELYCAGHLYEAAVAHYLATGKKTLLDVALKNANLVCNTFGPQGRHEVPGHQVIEMGLVKLYCVTGDERYLKTAQFFLDERGNTKGHELMGDYAQDDKPVRDQDVAEGHSVRAAYMYSGMADVAAMTGDDSYVTSLDKIWNDVVGTKLYITGGIGASGGNEGFSHPYELPNASAYCETCASIADAFWNERMFLTHGDGKYIDIVERTMYNSFLSGVSLSGDEFFYPNPLESFHGAKRSEWFGCACCPPNVLRFLPSIAGYIYAQDGKDLYVNLYIGSKAEVSIGDRSVRVEQTTEYPWKGNVKLAIDPDQQREFGVKVRIPGWAQNRPVPSDLYKYVGNKNGTVILKLNGKPIEYTVVNNFVEVRRVWSQGDVVEIELPMVLRCVVADQKLLDDNNRVSLERGPIVYCFEGVDTKDKRVTDLVLAEKASLKTTYRNDMLNGLEVVEGSATPMQRTLEGNIVTGTPESFLAIPYYAWAHRGRTEMTVWMATSASAARPFPAPTLAFTSKVTASDNRGAEAVNDQLLPKNSIDHSIPFLHWWPRKGTTEWVQYDFAAPSTVTSSGVYWFDDTGIGECRLPRSWRLLYKDGNDWKPVENFTGYAIEKDKNISVKFKPVKTSAMLLEIQSIPGFSSGIYEWSVE
jgi:DUF1680 family protein